MFKPIQAAVANLGRPQQGPDETGVKRVFMVLHGFYGNLFLSKFATGSTESGEDQGIANARRVWAHGLRDYDGGTVKAALARCRERHPEFPPSLPQFLQLCDACKPRQTYQPPNYATALEMSPELRAKRRAEALAKAQEMAREILADREPQGLDLLKQSIARAAAEAGGDECATLLRLDRMLSARSAA